MKFGLGLITAAGLGVLVAGCGAKERVQGVYDGYRADRQVESGELAAGDVYTAAVALNKREIAAIDAVAGRLDDPALQQFAEKVKRDHQASLEKLDTVAQSMEGLTSYQGKLTRDIDDEANDDAESLDDARGDDIDEEFIDVMIDSHQDALNTIDSKLMPSAQGELLQVISEMRQHVTMHLDEAKRLEEATSK